MIYLVLVRLNSSDKNAKITINKTKQPNYFIAEGYAQVMNFGGGEVYTNLYFNGPDINNFIKVVDPLCTHEDFFVPVEAIIVSAYMMEHSNDEINDDFFSKMFEGQDAVEFKMEGIKMKYIVLNY